MRHTVQGQNNCILTGASDLNLMAKLAVELLFAALCKLEVTRLQQHRYHLGWLGGSTTWDPGLQFASSPTNHFQHLKGNKSFVVTNA